jgi:hypothetical protein
VNQAGLLHTIKNEKVWLAKGSIKYLLSYLMVYALVFLSAIKITR